MPIYLLYGPHFFPSDAADSADTLDLQGPGYSSEGTHEDRGQESHLLLSSQNILTVTSYN